MAGRFSVEAVFKAVDQVTAPVRRMQRQINAFQRGINRGFENIDRRVQSLTSGLKRVAAAGAVAFAITSTAAANVVTTGADFEQSIINASAKFPGQIRQGTEAFEALSDAARAVGSQTEFTAGQAAEALNFLAMAGFNAESAVAALPGVVDLATASQTDLATATDIASDTLGAFGLSTKDPIQLGKNLARVNDVLAKTATTSNTSVSQLFESLRKGGPVARAAGSNIEEVAAMVGTMANAGIKAELAGTAVQNMFLNLSNPSKNAASLMRRLGITTRDAAGNLLPMPQILDNVGNATRGLANAQKSAAIETLFGREGLAGMIAVVDAGGDALAGYTKTLQDANGASKEMAGIMRDSVRGSLNSLNSAVEGVKISIFTMNRGPLKSAIDQMTQWVRANEKLISQNIGAFIKRIVDNFAEIVAVARGVAQFAAAFVALSVAMKVAQGAVMLFNGVVLLLNTTVAIARGALLAYTAVTQALPAAIAAARVALLALNIAFAANPIGLVISAVSAFIALAALLITAWDPVTEFFTNLFDTITSTVGSAIDGLKTVGRFIGLVDDEAPQSTTEAGPAASAQAQVVTQADRTANAVQRLESVNESRQTAEVVLRNETNSIAEVTRPFSGGGLSVSMSGAD